MQNHQQLACCGIDCATCDIFIAAHDPIAAQHLAEAWKAGGTPDAQPDWFRCQGCHADRSLCWSEDCRIYLCCTSKECTNCSQCSEFPCEMYRQWASHWTHHRAAYERLLTMCEQNESQSSPSLYP